MASDSSKLIDQIQRALNIYEEAKKIGPFDSFSYNSLPEEKQHEVLNILISTLQRAAPRTSSYWRQYISLSDVRKSGLAPINIPGMVGILQALKMDLESGLVNEFEELIHADIFSDFLEMAEYLLNSNYKDSSAVMIGGVLEEHLRKLAIKNGIAIIIGDHYKKADQINNETGSSGAYSKLDQKSITAWLDLRNNAAHGNYSAYVKEQVTAMLFGVRNFILRNPA